MKPIVIWMEEKNVAKLTKEELEEIIQQAYNQGYNAGYAAGYAISTVGTSTPSSPSCPPYVSWKPYDSPAYNPCTISTPVGTTEESKTHVTLKG